ncbi:MAG: polysaccharide biosynthesis tyrosine autokinase [Bacteroidales bacterium]|nr:polysaccharide biosynthesis tyrosine autokinase [Bacteroidales bacterium]
MSNENTYNNPQQSNEEQGVDIKNLIFNFLGHWYLFLIGAVVALAIGFIITRYTTKIYQTTGTVVIKEGRQGIDPTAIMTNIAYGNQQNLENEIAVIKSYSLTDRVVKKMGIEVSYWEKGRFVASELYKDTPFLVEFDRSQPQAVGLVYNIEFTDDEHFTLSAKTDKGTIVSFYDFILEQRLSDTMCEINYSQQFRQGEWFETGFNHLRIVLKDKYEAGQLAGRNLSFYLNSYPSLVKQMKTFSASPTNKQSSVVLISMSGANRKKIVDFTNTLLNEYVMKGLEKKNIVSENTIEFIDQQLGDIEESLSTAEQELKDFRTRNDLMNLDAQANQVYGVLQNLDGERAEMRVNVKIYKRLQEYIQSNIDDPENLAAPSTMGINDVLLNRLVSELVTLSQTKATQLLILTDEHPQIIKLDEQIVTIKKNLLENVNNIVSNAEMGLKEIENRIAQTEARSQTLPEKQRELLKYQRNFNLNDDTYKYLMQRRAEAQILKASNTPDNEILDIARLDTTLLVKPRAKMNYLIALIIGLLIPALYLFLKDFFNVTINERKDLEKLTRFPIIGQVAQVEDKNPLVVINSPKAPIAEAFRSIRTNIEFITQGKSKSIILVTGDVQGIGKTFNSINMASIYALYGKKTVLLGFDMRKPKLYQEFNLTNNIGLSSYLSNKEPLENIIQPSIKIPNLDVITSGPIPPNPAELIASEKCNELFAELKERYDYIVIDTPPLGLVTDAYLLMRFSDVNLFIVRQGQTNKNIFGSIIKDIEDRGLEASIVINGIESGKGYGYRYGRYRYGYGYGYAYGYGYGKYGYGTGYYGEGEEKEEKGVKGLIQRVFNGKKSHHHHHHHSNSKK